MAKGSAGSSQGVPETGQGKPEQAQRVAAQGLAGPAGGRGEEGSAARDRRRAGSAAEPQADHEGSHPEGWGPWSRRVLEEVAHRAEWLGASDRALIRAAFEEGTSPAEL